MADGALQIRRGASRSADPVSAVAELHAALDQPDAALVIVFCSAAYDLVALGAELRRRFGATPVIGCTTAGEITPLGYLSGSLTGVSLGASGFRAVTRAIPRLSEFKFVDGAEVGRELLQQLRQRGKPPSGSNSFGFLLIDGLSNQEENVVSTLSRSLGDVPLFGGSAADGAKFEATHVYCDGEFRSDAAVFTLVQTEHPFVVFKTQHFVSSTQKMVVTRADPARRIVTEINGEPAAREYAFQVDRLTPHIFAAHPVVVKVGGLHYVRSIQKVNPDGSLTFFCAIDEGIVLTVARGVDLVENLEQAFDDVRAKIGTPELVIGCDCILRLLELEQKSIKQEAARVFLDNNVVGFSTYGEQFNAMHVNQTFTGVAIGGGAA
jgi:hypothetical protein